MNVLVVDNEALQLDILKSSIKCVQPDCELTGFCNPLEALEWTKEHQPDVAFLDIQMPVMDGIALAKQLKLRYPKINLIFVTGYYEEYVFEAIPLYFSGYLQKPVNEQKVGQALANLRFPLIRPENRKLIKVRCFGDFEVYAGEKPLDFSLGKAKEIFAYLIDRKGAKVNGNKICAAVYENAGNESVNKSSLRNCVADIRSALHAVGADDVFLKGWDSYAIDTSLVDCDFYDWEKNEPYAIRAFHGEYMSQYSWAEETLASMFDQTSF